MAPGCIVWSMKAAVALAFALLLMSCSTGDEDQTLPRSEDVERLEAKVSSHPCVGNLGEWERNYRFGMSSRMFWPQSDHPDLDIIEFHYRKVGSFTIRPERNLARPSAGRDWRDSSSIQTIDGSYKISSGRLNVASCKRVSGKRS